MRSSHPRVPYTKRKRYTKKPLDFSEYDFIVGLDEVGWGAISGPIWVGAVALPVDLFLNLKDSKQYSSDKTREAAGEVVTQHTNNLITIPIRVHKFAGTNPLIPLKEAFSKAIDIVCFHIRLDNPDAKICVVIDGVHTPTTSEIIKAIPKADSLVQAVSAASILAKLARDKEMVELHRDYPHYNWLKNKGYASKEHISAMRKYGMSPHHRVNIDLVQQSHNFYLKSFIK